MVYIYLFLALLALCCVFAAASRQVKPSLWGPWCVAALAGCGVALALSSLSGTALLGNFKHPVCGTTIFQCDTLSSWFMLIVGALFVLGAFYGKAYLSHYNAKTRQQTLHWVSFFITLAGIFVLLTTRNLIVFLFGWEMMAIGSFFAVIFEYDRPQVLKAGLNYFIQSHIAVILITIVFAWSMSVTGSATYDGLERFFAESSATVQIVAMSLLIAGFGFKAGIVPFHSWLPLAHPAAPSHVSALMSGVIVKAGIYGIVRFGSMLVGLEAQLPIGVALLVLGIVSGLIGIINAAEHRDFKRMLAYCTIENIGIICMGLGVGFIGWSMGNVMLFALGMGGALFHVLNHALFKSLLFFGAGNVYTAVHTRNMEQLGGLGKLMPRTAGIFLFGSLAIGGLPPIGGFLSEIMIYLGFLDGFGADSLPMSVLMVVAGCSLAVIGGVSMLAFTKTFGVIFLGSPRSQLSHEPKEVSGAMLWPAYAVVAIVVAVLVGCGFVVKHLFEVSLSSFELPVLPENLTELANVVSLIMVVGRSMLIFALVIVVCVIVRRLVAARRPVSEGPTWGCGYMRSIAGIQYTGKSFAKTLVDMCRPLLPTTSRFTPIEQQEIFPTDRAHLSVDSDVVDQHIVKPGVDAISRGLDRFQFIQNGNLQRYIVYGLGYIVILVASVIIFG